MKNKRIAIIGAGPVGLEAALYAVELGYPVDLFEKGEVGENILKWGHVTLFSPWEMNHSALGPSLLRKHLPSWEEPDPGAYLTGAAYVARYLRPLSTLPQLAGRIHTGVRVQSIGRERILKGELIGDAHRAAHPFRLLTTHADGRERIYHADVVIDATGVYDTPNWLGDGGIPAVGERTNRRHIDYHLRDVTGRDRGRFAGKRTLLVGAGYSAATTVCDFQSLIQEEPETALLWVIRDNRAQPIPVIEHDSLPNRAALTRRANAIAENGSENIEFWNNTTVQEVQYFDNEQRFRVTLKRNETTQQIEVDRILANVGYGPDNSLYRELQVHECFASRGPMKLAAALLGSGSSGDCLTQQSMGAETLRNPEPDFFIIGNKSYGRNPSFLIRIGLRQIVEVFSLLTGESELDLYASATTENQGVAA